MDVKDDTGSLECLGLSQPLESIALKHQFCCKLFRVNIGFIEFKNTDDGFQAFFNRYETLRRLAINRSRVICDCTYSQLLHIADMIRKSDETRANLKPAIFAYMNPETVTGETSYDAVTIIMDLAASMLSLMVIGDSRGGISYDEEIAWEDNKKLKCGIDHDQQSLIATVFSTRPSADIVKLPQSFTAANLEKIAGIQIRWTNNLADHLLLRDDDTKLMLFHQVSALSWYPWADDVLPLELPFETIRTISLLIPPSLGEPNPWFRQEQQKHRLDAQAGLCHRLNSSERQIDKFHYWRERLVLLKRTYDDAEPKNLKQLWFDDRKKTQWFTFWVAVLVFIMTISFGVIQSVASVVQAWASVKALRTQG
ncbi:MAG: hypothetical protein Q9201_006848 [Fulgogasparrea decipioides]